MRTPPETEHDWTIHSINIHGAFFERWCQEIVSAAPTWKLVSTNYPVGFPPSNGPFRGSESTLDIRAEKDRRDFRVTLVIECKKTNPEFINWIFFPKLTSATPEAPIIASQISNVLRENSANWSPTTSRNELRTTLPICDEAREVRGAYRNVKNGAKTKTSNAAIHDAAYQVALATQAIVYEDGVFSRKQGERGNPTPLAWSKAIYLPVVITTAKLFLCEFDPRDIDAATGEVPPTKVQLVERNELIFEYSIPRHLQMAPSDIVEVLGENKLHWFTTMHILVVHGAHLPDFLRTLFVEPEEKGEPGTVNAQ